MKDRIKWLKKPMHFGLALLLVAILGIGTTVAFFTDIEAAVNSITTGKVGIDTNEEVKGLTKSNIGVTATGTSKCYVRVRVDIPTVTYKYTENGDLLDGSARITYLDEGGNTQIVSSEQWQSVQKILAKISGGESGEETATWHHMSDNYWYLSTTLKKGEYATFLNKITYPGLWKDGEVGTAGKVVLPDGLTLDMLTIPITSEAVQKEGINVGESTGAAAAEKAFQAISQQ